MRLRGAALLAVALLTLAACVQGNAGIPAARTRVVATASPASKRGARARPDGAEVWAGMATPRLSPRVADVPSRVYVPNNRSSTLTEIDPATYRVIRTIRVGSGPQHVTPSWDLRHLYVGNTYSNTLTQIDPRSGRVVRTISVPDPYNLYFTPDGSLAVDVAERLQRLYFFDPHTWKPRGSVAIPWPGADHLDFSEGGGYLLISTEFAGVVVKVNIRKRQIVGSVHVGGSPVDVKLSPDGSVFYVANQIRGGVSVIDPVRMREVRFIRTGAGAHGFCISRDAGELYVSNRVAGTISVLNFTSGRLERTWHVGGSPDMMQVSADGRELWVSNRYHGTVSVISTRTGHVIRTIHVGSGPHGLTLFPQPGRFSIGHNGVYR